MDKQHPLGYLGNFCFLEIMLVWGIIYSKLYTYNQKLYTSTLATQVWDFHSDVICLQIFNLPNSPTMFLSSTASLLGFGAHFSTAESYVIIKFVAKT